MSQTIKSKILIYLFALATLSAVLLVAGVVWAGQNGDLEVCFFDVGQGDSIFIRTPRGQNILVDGGPDRSVLKGLSESLPWWDRTIDLMILTHPHDDHVGGLNYVMDRYDVERVLYTGAAHSAPAYLTWLEKLRKSAAKIHIADRVQNIKFGPDCRLEVIYPSKPLSDSSNMNLNDTSLVARLVYGQTSFLLTGDIEAAAENELLSSKQDLRADILKVAHHGSDTSTQVDFLDAVEPKMAVIMSGRDNDFGFPSPRVLDRLQDRSIDAWRTDVNGTLKLASDGSAVSID